MRRLYVSILLLLSSIQPVFAQKIGERQAVKLLGTSTPLTLDFSDRDYMLFLYSLYTDLPPDLKENPEYEFSVFSISNGASSVSVPNPRPGATVHSGGGLEAQLRKREHALARLVRQTGGYRPPGTDVAPHPVGAHRFAFPAFGNVPDTTVTAVLFAEGHRASAYVDVSDTSRVSRARGQADVELFGLKIHPVLTSALVREPRAAEVGRIYLLYTHLVDEVGDDTTTVRGFFNASSLLPENQGGNGDQINLLFINPFNDPGVTDVVLAHEFQHLFSFHQHVLIRNGQSEEDWLNEGLSHLCEDMVGRHETHNRQNIERFLANPRHAPLRGSVDNPGVRGAAYLFVRSLIEDFGMGILPRLVQTNHVGLRNVREASGDYITDIYERFLSRLVLSGSGINPSLEFTTPLLADSTSGARRFPHPDIIPVTPETSPGQGSVQPLSAAFLQLSYGKTTTIWLQTDAAGSPTVFLIPIPPEDQTRIAIPTDFFRGITFDAPVAGPFFTYEPIRVSGAVSDTLISEIEFVLLLEDYSRKSRFAVPVRDGTFSQTFFLSHEQAGRYRLQAGTRREAQQDFQPAGAFGTFTIAEGPETSPIPVSYFTDIVLSSPIPVEARTGQAIRISGAVSDTTLTAITFRFRHEDVDRPAHFEAPVIDGQFSKTVLFTHGQSGVHQLTINRQRGDTNYALPQDAFSPFVVTQGEGPVLLPVDFFHGIRLDAPMPIAYRIGHPVRVDGAVSDSSVSRIEFSFSTFGGDTEPSSGQSDTRFFAQVINGQFSMDVAFSREQQVSDDYTLNVWLWRNGGRSAGFRRFEPISIGASRLADFNDDGSVGFADFIVFAKAFGSTSADTDFDPRFDLDGDGTVGFGDFVIFAGAFGG